MSFVGVPFSNGTTNKIVRGDLRERVGLLHFVAETFVSISRATLFIQKNISFSATANCLKNSNGSLKKDNEGGARFACKPSKKNSEKCFTLHIELVLQFFCEFYLGCKLSLRLIVEKKRFFGMFGTKMSYRRA